VVISGGRLSVSKVKDLTADEGKIRFVSHVDQMTNFRIERLCRTRKLRCLRNLRETRFKLWRDFHCLFFSVPVLELKSKRTSIKFWLRIQGIEFKVLTFQVEVISMVHIP